MSRILTANYTQGIHELNCFMELLEAALKGAMPGVSLSREAAFNWRGYQIGKFAGLKTSQYYCQIYLDAPQILVFEEYYDMTHYPYQVKIDLAAQHFFELQAAEQKTFLVDFIRLAVKEALDWNASSKRKKIVDAQHL